MSDIYEIPNCKVILLGNTCVGKTSIVGAATPQGFVEDQSPTIGACFVIKKMEINGQNVRLHLWDTAGQERFKSLAPMYYRDANFAIIVYAINDEPSYGAAQMWYDGVQRDCPVQPDIFLVANKIDLEADRKKKKKKGEELASKMNATYIEVSAKDGTNIEELFKKIASKSIEINTVATKIDVNETKIDPATPAKKNKNCC